MRLCTLLLLLLCFSVLAAPSKQFVLVEPQSVSAKNLTQWQRERYKGVAVVLEHDFQKACATVTKAGLDLYGWIEVGRNPAMADAHPEWMGSIGMHKDWQKRFPDSRLPKTNEVAKAYPWVPITGEDAFQAHLARVKNLLRDLPPNFSGIFLNDLQGAPSSCGCGNLQCRWAVDYHVPATATQSSPDNAAARFIAEVQKLAPGKTVIPVWTIECEQQDMPTQKGSTGYCGEIRCATGSCPTEFTKQWNALRKAHSGPIALLAVHTEFQRSHDWIADAVNYVGDRLERTNLWLVVRDQARAKDIAATVGPAALLVSRTRIDQSYSPRIIAAGNQGVKAR
jgi:hypothetical protein